MLKVFGSANLVLAPILLAGAVLDVLGLTSAGNIGLAIGAAVAGLFGVWQLVSGSRHHPAPKLSNGTTSSVDAHT